MPANPQKRKGMRELYWVVLGQLVAVAGGFIGLKLLTNLMSAEDFGFYQLIWSIALLGGIAFYNPFGHAIMRTLPLQPNATERNRLTSEIYSIFLKVAAGLVFLILLSALLSVWLQNLPVAIIFTALIAVIFHGTTLAMQHFQSALRQRKRYALSQAAISFGRPLGAVAFILFFSSFQIDIPVMALLGSACALALVLLLQLSFTRTGLSSYEVSNEDAKGKTQTSLFHIAKPMMAIGCLTVLSQYADRWIMAGSIDLAQIGIYTAIYQIVSGLLNFVQGTANRFALPILFQKFGTGSSKDDHAVARKQSQMMILSWSFVSFGMFLSCYVLHEFIVRLLTTEEIAGSSSLLIWLFVGMSLERTAQILTVKGNLELKIGRYVPARILHIVLLIGFGLLMQREYGIYGFAYAHIISGAGLVLATLWLDRRIYAQDS